MNLGDHCWLYAAPRDQWRGGRSCPAFEDPDAYRRFRESRKEPDVMTRKELRREIFRRHKRVNRISRRSIKR